MRYNLYLLILIFQFLVQFSWGQNPNWAVENQSSYTYTMSLVATMQDDCLNTNFVDSQIAIFDSEAVCRGVANLISTSQGYRAFLTVFSNDVIDQFFYRIYDGVEKQVYFSHINKLDFIAESIQGSISNPISIFYDSESEVDAGSDQTIDDNPFAILDASSTQSGTWIIHYGEGGNFENATDRNTRFYGQANETYMLIWVVVDNNCLNEMDHVFITFNEIDEIACPIAVTFDEIVLFDTDTTINAVESIISYASIEANASVVYQAGETITLKAGFHAQFMSDFHAKIEGCNPPNIQLIEARTTNAHFKTATSLEIFPNPTQSNVQINYFLPKAAAIQLQLFDTSGNLLHLITEKGIKNWNMVELSLDQIPKGMYYLRFSNEVEVTTEKLLVN